MASRETDATSAAGRAARSLFSRALPAVVFAMLAAASPSHADTLATLEEDGLSVALDSTAPAEFRLAVRTSRPAAGAPPEVLLLHSPLRLVLEVPHSGFGAVREVPLADPLLIALRIGTEPERSRVVVELEGSSAPAYTVKGEDPAGGITLSFTVPSRSAGQSQQTSQAPAANAAPAGSPPRIGAYTVHNDQIRMVAIHDKKTLSKKLGEEKDASQAGPHSTRLLANRFDEELELRRKEISNLMEGRFNYSQPASPTVPAAVPPTPPLAAKPPQRAPWMPLAFAGTAIVLSCSLLAFILRRRLREHFEPEYYLESAPRHPDTERLRLEQLRREKKLAQCYAILGVREHDSFEEIKNRYKHLAKVFHEDKLTSQDLPDEMLQLASERFKSIQNAYETLKKEKNFN